jgi:branched-chain amino acid transport system substrate-binding protein
MPRAGLPGAEQRSGSAQAGLPGARLGIITRPFPAIVRTSHKWRKYGTREVCIDAIAAVVAAGISGCSEKKEQVTKKEVVVTPPPAPPPAPPWRSRSATSAAHRRHRAPRQGQRERRRLCVEEANAAKIKIDGKEASSRSSRRRPGRPEGRHDGRAEARRCQGGRRRRPPELGTSIPPRRSTARPASGDFRIRHQSQADRAGLQDAVPRGRRDDQQGPAIASYLAESKKPKLVAVIDDATAYGEGIANEVEKTLKAANIKVLPREKGTDKTTDWKAVLTKVKGKNADAVFYGGMDATGGPLLKQGRELGVKGGVFVRRRRLHRLT